MADIAAKTGSNLGQFIDALGKRLGVDTKELIEEVKANLALLDACSVPHDFQPVPSERLGFVRDYVCSKCHGRVNSDKAHWYQKGLEHARR